MKNIFVLFLLLFASLWGNAATYPNQFTTNKAGAIIPGAVNFSGIITETNASNNLAGSNVSSSVFRTADTIFASQGGLFNIQIGSSGTMQIGQSGLGTKDAHVSAGDFTASGTGFTGNGAGLTNLSPAATHLENIVYYGADPTGAANSYSAMTNALAHAISSGFKVYVPSGNYTASNSVPMPDASNISVVGDGMGKSVLSYRITGGGGYGFQFPVGSTATNITFRGLTIKGATKYTNDIVTGIGLETNVTDVLVEECEFRNSVSGVGAIGGGTVNHRVKIRNCLFDDMRNASAGMVEVAGDDLEISGNVFDDRNSGQTNNTQMHAVYLAKGNNCKINFNQMFGTNSSINVGQAAIGGWLTNLSVTGNQLFGTHGSFFLQTVNSEIRDNIFASLGGNVSLTICRNVGVGGNLFSDEPSVTSKSLNLLVVDRSTNLSLTANILRGYATNNGNIGIYFSGANGLSGPCKVNDNTILGLGTQIQMDAGHGSQVFNNALRQSAAVGTTYHFLAGGATNMNVRNNIEDGTATYAFKDDGASALSFYLNNSSNATVSVSTANGGTLNRVVGTFSGEVYQQSSRSNRFSQAVYNDANVNVTGNLSVGVAADATAAQIQLKTAGGTAPILRIWQNNFAAWDIGEQTSSSILVMSNTSHGLAVTLNRSNLLVSGSITSSNIMAMPTNYVAANFVPQAGLVVLAPSNGALYSVTQLSTNFISGP